MPWIEDLVSLISTAGAGTATVDLFATSKHAVPPGEEPITSIIETPGSGAEETHNSLTQPAYHFPGAQLIVRGKDVVATRARARAVYLALRIANRSVNGVWYRKIRALQEPADYGLDNLERIQFVFNVVGDKSFS